MLQNSSESETSQNYLERNPICATSDMRSRRFWNKLDIQYYVIEIPSKDMCAGLFSTGTLLIEVLSSR